MLSVADLNQAAQAYIDGEVSLNQFVEWIEDASLIDTGSPKVETALLAIDLLLSRLQSGDLERADLKNALRPGLTANRGAASGQGRYEDESRRNGNLGTRNATIPSS